MVFGIHWDNFPPLRCWGSNSEVGLVHARQVLYHQTTSPDLTGIIKKKKPKPTNNLVFLSCSDIFLAIKKKKKKKELTWRLINCEKKLSCRFLTKSYKSRQNKPWWGSSCYPGMQGRKTYLICTERRKHLLVLGPHRAAVSIPLSREKQIRFGRKGWGILLL
jgi:hypothetical protein